MPQRVSNSVTLRTVCAADVNLPTILGADVVPAAMVHTTVWRMRWMRRRGDHVIITTGKYAGQTSTVESNV